MAQQPTSSKRSIDDVYKTDVLGGTGEKYSRLIAIGLITRATHGRRTFKLGIEAKDADKFDDVAFHNESTNEWWLIQAKHSLDAKELNWEALFPANSSTGDFAIVKYFKSYLHIKQSWLREGEKVRLFLFTNRNLKKSVTTKEASVDEIMRFSVGSHVQLEFENLQAVTNYMNYIEICETLVKLFDKPDNKVIKILQKYTKLVSEVLTRDGSCLKFRASYLENNPEFHEILKSAFINKNILDLSVNVPEKMPDLWSELFNHNHDELTLISDETVKTFFDSLVLSVSQPNVEKLSEEIQSDWRRWIKGWIRPDVYQRLTEDQLSEPFNTFRKCFDEWERPWEKSSKRGFMTGENSTEWLQVVEGKLKEYVILYGRQGYVGLDAAENYYVNRRIACEDFLKWSKKKRGGEVKDVKKVENEDEKESATGSGEDKYEDYSDDEFSVRYSYLDDDNVQQSNDDEFVDWLCQDWTNKQFITLFAEPGMGKSTLWQYLAFRAQQKHLEVEVFLIYLNDLNDLKTTNDEKTNITAVKIFEARIKNSTPSLDKLKKTVIFLDAFDELQEENKGPILNSIKVLGEHKRYVKFLVSSRERSKKELEENLGEGKIEKIDIMPFHEGNRREFLRSFWNTKDTIKFDAFSSELLSKFDRESPRRDINFIGLPLTMKMLAEVFQNEFKQYLASTENTDPSSHLSKISINIISVYERFIDNCIRFTLNKKWKVDPYAKAFDYDFEPKITSVKRNYQLLALQQMELSSLIGKSQKDQLEKFREGIREEREESHLLETVDGKPRFLHRSYAEYFCAAYLFEELSKTGTIAQKNLEQLFEKHNVIRKLFLKILDAQLNIPQQTPPQEIQKIVQFLESETDKAEAWACEDNCANLLSKILKVYKLTKRYHAGNPLLHIAAESNACEAMEVLLDAAPLDINIKNNYGKNPLSVACERGNLDMVKLLVERGAKHSSEAMELAFQRNHMQIVEYLTSDAIDVNAGYNSNKNMALLFASQTGHLTTVRQLFERGATAVFIDYRGMTALHKAGRNGYTSIVRELLARGANIEMQCKSGFTPLHYAARNGKINTIRLLLEKGANVDHVDSKQRTTLHYAADWMRTAVVLLLLEYNANIHARDEDGNTPLHLAGANGGLDVIQLLVAKAAFLEATNCRQQTALHCAAAQRETAAIEKLLECGANINAQDKDGNTPLHHVIASYWNEGAKYPLNAVRLLISKGANVKLANRKNKTAMHVAFDKGISEVVHELFICGIDDNAQDNNGNTSLHLPAREGRLDVVQITVEREAFVDSMNSRQQATLHHAARWGKTAIMEKLIECGADINAQDEDGNTPLHHVITNYGNAVREMKKVDLNTNSVGSTSNTKVENSLLNAVRLLISKRANVELANRKQKTVLHVAVDEGLAEIVEELLRCEIDINAQCDNGNTPLHLAVIKGGLDVVRILVKNGANVNNRNSSKRTALHEAAEQGKIKIIRLLLESGAYTNVLDEYWNTPVMNLIINFRNIMENITLNESTNEMFPLHAVRLLIASGTPGNLMNSQHSTALHVAAKDGIVEVVQELLQCEIDVNAQDKEGNTPLHWAALKGELYVVRLLVENGAFLDLKNSRQETALHLAAWSSEAETVCELHQCGASINVQDEDGDTPLHNFIANFNNLLQKTMECKLNNDSKPYYNRICMKSPIEVKESAVEVVRILFTKVKLTNRKKQTVLHVAAKEGIAEIVGELLKYEIDVNAQDDDGNTSLHYAALRGELHVVRLLVEKGAILDHTNSQQKTALHLAAWRSEVAIVCELLEWGASINVQDEDGDTPLHNVIANFKNVLQRNKECKLNNDSKPHYDRICTKSPIEWECALDVVRILVAKGTNVKLTNRKQKTVLHVAAKEGTAEIVRELLKCEIDVNAQDDHGDTPLHCAASNNGFYVVRLLVENGAILDLKNSRQKTALHLAAWRSEVAIVRELVECGASINVQDEDGDTSLHNVISNFKNVLQETMECKLNNNSKPYYDRICMKSPIEVKESALDIVRILITKGANVKLPNTEQKTVLQVAFDEGVVEVVGELLKCEVDDNVQNADGDAPHG